MVGAGAIGVATARVLRGRGFEVTLVERGSAPHPDAASTDLSKLVRGDYGVDAFYTDLMERALEGFRERNRRWCRAGGRALFHETGFLVLSSVPFASGGFENDSFSALLARGYPLERLDAARIAQRFPVLAPGRFVDGYVNPAAGWAESGAVVAAELDDARAEGIHIVANFSFAGLVERAGRVTGVRSHGGAAIEADVVVLAAGTWLPKLLPELADRIRSTGHPVMVFQPSHVAPLRVPSFLPWAADIGRTGWYGFPANADGLVKVANHGAGHARDPDAPRSFPAGEEPRFRAFLRGAVPSLADAKVALERLCFYADSFDGDFLIARHPERPGLVVATGDSGHAFKFMPVLGELVADAVEARPNPVLERFRWRKLGDVRAEQARCRE